MTSIDCLPEEILEYILSFTSPYEDLRNCKSVCHLWNRCCKAVVKKRKSRFLAAIHKGAIKWSNIDNPNHLMSITRRYSHSAVIHDTCMYVFGGCTASNTTFNDLWKFNLGTCSWARLLTTGTYPSPKTYATMVVWNHYLILFGGWTHPSQYPLHQQWVLYNELHIYDIVENHWTAYNCPNSPPPTAGHSASVHGNLMVIIGGFQKVEGITTSTMRVYCYNLIRHFWFRPIIVGEQPFPRHGQSQIKIDDHHILIIAGSGGSNKLYNDVWMLKLPLTPEDPNVPWQWQNIIVEDTENAPSQMWYNPACKVDDYVVMLCNKNLNNENKNGGNMAQLLVPGMVRRQVGNLWVPPQNNANENVRPPPDAGHVYNPIIDHNVNGQKGYLRSGARARDLESSSDESDDPNVLGSGARGRFKPSIRPNASSDKERRLKILARMEERLKSLSENNRSKNVPKSKNGIDMKCKLNSNISLVPHLLDIRKIVSTGVASWIPRDLKNECSLGESPHQYILYSLLLGRGHLVMFGGILNDPSAQNDEMISNTVTFLSASSLLHATL